MSGTTLRQWIGQEVTGVLNWQGNAASFIVRCDPERVRRDSRREANGWTDWLGQQLLFDRFASLDGKRQRSQTIAEFIAQESRYIPDINDGVRVNIAPLQKAGCWRPKS